MTDFSIFWQNFDIIFYWFFVLAIFAVICKVFAENWLMVKKFFSKKSKYD